MGEKKYFRTIEEIYSPLEANSHIGKNTINTKRVNAIKKVLRCIPPEEFEIIDKKEFGIQWVFLDNNPGSGIIPAHLSEEQCLENKYSIAVYLPSYLEELDEEITTSIIAHELAHIALGHCGKKVSNN